MNLASAMESAAKEEHVNLAMKGAAEHLKMLDMKPGHGMGRCITSKCNASGSDGAGLSQD